VGRARVCVWVGVGGWARARYICPRDDDTRWWQCRKIIIFHAQSLAVRRQVQKVNTPETRRDRFQNVFTVKFSDHFRNDQKVVLLFNFGLTAHTSPLHTILSPSFNIIYECVTVYFDVSPALTGRLFKILLNTKLHIMTIEITAFSIQWHGAIVFMLWNRTK